MPRADPNRSFEIAVRHLFRHLDDAAALKRNPIVSRFFPQQVSNQVAPEQSARTATQVRALAVLAAKKFRDLASDSSERERRERQLTIVEAQCAGNKPIPALAHELGVSVRECYRERAEVHRWIGSFIRSYEPALVTRTHEPMSEAQFQLERAAARAEAGDYDRALRGYRGIAASAAADDKARALCEMVDVELERGSLASASTFLADLLRTLAARAETPATETARTYGDLLEAKLAWASGDFEAAAQVLARALEKSDGFEKRKDRATRALRVNIMAESGNRAIEHGEFERAERYLTAADEICNQDTTLNLARTDLLLARVNLNVTRMRPESDVSLRQQIPLADRAEEIATQSGSLKRRLLVETLQVQLQTPVQNAPREIARVLSIVNRFRNRRLAAVISMEFADYLLQGPYWRRAERLLIDAFPKSSYHWALSMHLRGVYRLRIGDATGAYAFESAASEIAQRAANSRLHAAALRGLATSAYLLSRADEAADYIAAAIPISERYGSLTSCRKTYQSAAFITGDSRYARRAESFRRAVKG